jgi:hypothetical protein
MTQQQADTKQAAGYVWNPVTGQWERPPAEQGQRQGSYISNLLSSSGLGGPGGGGVGGAGTPGVGGSSSLTGLSAAVGGGPNAAAIGPINNDAANAAAFSKAKDTAGSVGRASLDSLRGELGATGALGGGAEVQGVRDIAENAAGGLRDVSNQQAITNSNQALDIAKTNQGAAVTQRGQDIAAQEAMARLALEQAQLAWQRQMQALSLAFQGPNMNGPGNVDISKSGSSSTGGGGGVSAGGIY